MKVYPWVFNLNMLASNICPIENLKEILQQNHNIFLWRYLETVFFFLAFNVFYLVNDAYVNVRACFLRKYRGVIFIFWIVWKNYTMKYIENLDAQRCNPIIIYLENYANKQILKWLIGLINILFFCGLTFKMHLNLVCEYSFQTRILLHIFHQIENELDEFISFSFVFTLSYLCLIASNHGHKSIRNLSPKMCVEISC